MSVKELEILKKAILIEKEGYEFYKIAADKAVETEVKDAFLYLASEEKNHESWLRSLYHDIEKQQPISLDVDHLQHLEPSTKIFNWENISPESGSLAVSVFGIGVNIEKKAIDYYHHAARETTIPEAKKLYEILIVWETEHLDLFQKNYDLLKDEWWDTQHFSPA